MQYHWIALIVIIALHKNIKFGLIVNALTIIGFAPLSSFVIYIYDFPPGYVSTGKRFVRNKSVIEFA